MLILMEIVIIKMITIIKIIITKVYMIIKIIITKVYIYIYIYIYSNNTYLLSPPILVISYKILKWIF